MQIPSSKNCLSRYMVLSPAAPFNLTLFSSFVSLALVALVIFFVPCAVAQDTSPTTEVPAVVEPSAATEPPSNSSPQEKIIRIVEKRGQLAQQEFAAQLSAELEALRKLYQEEKISADAWQLDSPEFFAAIDEVIQLEPKSRETVTALFSARLMQALSSRQAQHLADYYRIVLESRPDPDVANVELRKQIVFNARGNEAKIFGLGRLAELRFAKALTFFDQVRVVLHGYYGRSFLYVGGVLAFIALMAAGVAMIRPFLWILVAKQIARKEEQEKVEAEINSKIQQRRASSANQPTEKLKRPIIRPSNKAVSGYARGPAEEDEYSRLLGVLGLDDDATESAIKKSYREMVKNLHPDGSGTTQQTDGFIELKEVYDRILEIRSSWFGGKR